MRLLILLIFITFSLSSWAQLRGIVQDSKGQAIPFATLAWKKKATGTLADSLGRFQLSASELTNDTLEIAAMGYSTRRIPALALQGKLTITLQSASAELPVFVMSSDREPVLLRESPVNISVINRSTFEQTQSNSLADGLRFSPGLQVENNCQNCGFVGVRLNGLPPAYTQILINSRPVYSALAAVYGLEQIPPAMIEQIEVVQGGGSVLFGGNAIAGTVNIITTTPNGKSFEAGLQQSRIGLDAPDTYAYASGSWLNKKRTTGLQGFSAFRYRNPWDIHNDGFTEITRLQSHASGIQFFHEPGSRSKLSGSARYIQDERRGGSSLFLAPHESEIAEWIAHRIAGADLNYSLQSRNSRRKFEAYSAFQRVLRESYYGGSSHPEPLSQYGFSSDYNGVLGIQVVQKLKRWNGRILLGNESLIQGLRDQFRGQIRSLEQQSISSGTYIQYSFQPAPKTNISAGFRMDYQDIRGDFQFPDNTFSHQRRLWVPNVRATIRQSLMEKLSLRYQLNTGFRGPQVFDEDLHIDLAGSNLRFIRMAENLRTERSLSQSIGADYNHDFMGWSQRYTISAFHTQLMNPFVIEGPVEQSGNVLIMEKRNGSGAQVSGINAEAKVKKQNHSIQAGLTLQRALFKEAEVIFEDEQTTLSTNQLLRTPDVYGYVQSAFGLGKSWYAAASLVYTGSMRIAHMTNTETGFTELKVTPDFWDASLRIMRSLTLGKHWNLEIDGGVNNLFNQFQRDLDIGFSRDPGYVYGPLRPRTFTFGMRLKWKE